MSAEIQVESVDSAQVQETNFTEYAIIASQTGIDDKLVIERTYMECGNDISKTILKLLDLLPPEVPQKEPTDMEMFRQILDEKEAIYRDIVAANKK